jgi:hypothetical protein
MHVTGNRRIAVECTKIKTGPFGAGNTARALTAKTVRSHDG